MHTTRIFYIFIMLFFAASSIFGGRYYNSETGVWYSVDPLAHEYPGLSPYNYCGNNPLIRVDPDGKAWDTILDVVSVAVSTYELVTNPSWENAGVLAADVGATLLPFVPSATSVKLGAKTVKAIDNLIGGAKTLHGNSKASTKAQHVYEIIETGTNKVVKTGVSSGKITTKTGKSQRATSQVNKWNKAESAGKYDSRVVKEIPSGPGARQKALDAEKSNAKKLIEQGHLQDPDKHKIPR